MGLFSSKPGHGMPKGLSKGRPKGSQKGTARRDHQRSGFNFSEGSTHSRSWLFGAPRKYGK